MNNNLGYKLVAIADVNTLKLFKAQGLKILEKIGSFDIKSDTNHKRSKHEGFGAKKHSQSSFYDPHTQAKNIEYTESSKTATNYIKEKFIGDKNFKELYLIADSKMLGYIRIALDNNLVKFVKKEVQKELISHNTKDLERAIFS